MQLAQRITVAGTLMAMLAWVSPVAGQTFTGTLNAVQNKGIHKIKLQKGTFYTIDMTSPQFDTYLYLKDAKGQLVGKDDDGGQGLNSRLGFTPKDTGEYTIEASSFGGSGQGNYTIVVKALKPIGKPVVFKGKIDGNSPRFKNLPYHAYKIKMVAGNSYKIDLMSQQFDPILGVRLPNNQNLLAGDDDGGEGLNSRLMYSPPATSEYELLLGSLNQQFGDFTLTIQQYGTPPKSGANN